VRTLPDDPWAEKVNPSFAHEYEYDHRYVGTLGPETIYGEFSASVAAMAAMADGPSDIPTKAQIPGQREPASHRRRSAWARLQARKGENNPDSSPRWSQFLNVLIAVVTAVVAILTTLLDATISYPPLSHLAAIAVPSDAAHVWPLLLFGPWLVAFLSILRAAIHRRRACQSWAIVVILSALTVFLCMASAPRTLTGLTIGGIPPVTALICFHQLVRQITLTSPPRHSKHPGQ
jgi:hypothetical protein